MEIDRSFGDEVDKGGAAEHHIAVQSLASSSLLRHSSHACTNVHEGGCMLSRMHGGVILSHGSQAPSRMRTA